MTRRSSACHHALIDAHMRERDRGEWNQCRRGRRSPPGFAHERLVSPAPHAVSSAMCPWPRVVVDGRGNQSGDRYELAS